MFSSSKIAKKYSEQITFDAIWSKKNGSFFVIDNITNKSGKVKNVLNSNLQEY